VKEICPTTTQKWIKDGALIVDVRETNEVAALGFDVPYLMNIPLNEFEGSYNTIPREKNVVLVCQSGTRSHRAEGFLVNHGYEKVVNMQHGMNKWQERGFPVIGKTKPESEDSSCCSSGGCC
jgi:rhodanese-related sulfurtransferase